MTNYSRYESSPDKNNKDTRPKIQPGSRKNERVPSYGQIWKNISNDGRNNAFKDKNKDDKFNKDKLKYNQFQKEKTNYDSLTSAYSDSNKNYLNLTDIKKTPYNSYTQPIQNKDKDKRKYDI